MNKSKVLRRVLQVVLALVLVLVLAAGGYVAYMQFQYYRIPDNELLTVGTPADGLLHPGEEYTALTYNIGFGAYGPDYSFFMDKGTMADGTEVTGQYGKALSKQSVLDHTQGAIELLQAESADFVLLQEVDVKADRSYKVNQVEAIQTAMSGYGSVFANNFHSAYLFYPFSDPHGAVQAGLLTLSRARIDVSALGLSDEG